MNRSDREAWQSARTVEDLGRLGARWIEGDLASQPAYEGPSDIESPDMIPVLASLNRAGYYTIASQAGEEGPGFDGARWVQHAAVEGFASATVAERISRVAKRAGMTVIAHDPAKLPRRRIGYRRAVTVTYRDGRACTSFGAHLSRSHLYDPQAGYGILRPDALAALCAAWQVTVTDPVPGRRGVLWEAMAGVAWEVWR
jgi:hypothetical protein